MKPDLLVQGGATVFLISSGTKRGRRWLAEHLDGDQTVYGDAVAVEHRYLAPIVEGARDDGLRVKAA